MNNDLKTVYVGDVHGERHWRKIVNGQSWDRIIFVGDYVDSFHIKYDKQLRNLQNIIELKLRYPDKVTLLIGNHDHPYIQNYDNYNGSGWQYQYRYLYEHIFANYKDLFQIATVSNGRLVTHAGVSDVWLKRQNKQIDTPLDEFLNDLYKYQPYKFDFADDYKDPSGGDSWQSPLWIRPWALKPISYNQIVGHTPQVIIKTGDNSLLLTDTVNSMGLYLYSTGIEQYYYSKI